MKSHSWKTLILFIEFVLLPVLDVLEGEHEAFNPPIELFSLVMKVPELIPGFPVTGLARKASLHICT